MVLNVVASLAFPAATISIGIASGSLPIALASIGIGAHLCKPHVTRSIPISNRSQAMFIPGRLERALGRFADWMLQGQYVFWLGKNQEDVTRCSRVLGRLIDGLERLKHDMPEADFKHLPYITWKLAVVDRPQCNALASPSGTIFIFRGLLERTKDDDDKLALILGHEMAHVIARHTGERLSWSWIAYCCMCVLNALIGKAVVACTFRQQRKPELNPVQQIQQFLQRHADRTRKQRAPKWKSRTVHQIQRLERWAGSKAIVHGAEATTSVLMTLPLSRRHEAEADLIGLKLVHAAGFDMKAAVEVWGAEFWKPKDRLEAVWRKLNYMPPVMSTHPGRERRLQILNTEIDAMTPGSGHAELGQRKILTRQPYWLLS